jgi:hypothetical protein
MTLRVVGAGVGRTGTESLKLALEKLLGGRCYHMLEVLQQPESAIPHWEAAGRGEMPDWEQVFRGYVACVDWPAAAYWPEISEAYPDALVLLSTRSSAEEWYRSAQATIFSIDPTTLSSEGGTGDFISGIFRRFTLDLQNQSAAITAYEAHNASVRAAIPPGRLLEWQPGDGWGPLCRELGVPEPDEPFPHVNTTEMFRQRIEQLTGEPSAPPAEP